MSKICLRQRQTVKPEISPTSNSENKEMEVVKETVITNNGTPLSDYELQRLKRIEERKKFAKSISMDLAKQEFAEVVKSVKPTKKPVKRKVLKVNCDNLPPREPSRRIRNMKVAENSLKEEIKEEEEEEESKDERILGSKKMCVDEESMDVAEILDNFKSNIENPVNINFDIDLTTCDVDTFLNCIRCFKLYPTMPKVVSKRVQSICFHPSPHKRLVIAGSASGHIGLWDMDIKNEKGLIEFQPHHGPTNCISVSKFDSCKIYSTSHDGVVLCADIDKGIFSNVYATDFSERVKHLTWHDELDANTMLAGHGNGLVLLIDKREPQTAVNLFPCFTRSTRTVQLHPLNPNYFLASSGLGVFKVVDIRNSSKSGVVSICEVEHTKGLTSAFFSGKGNSVLTTCNDDKLSVYDVHGLSGVTPKLTSSYTHNNHTGRWLSVFKAMWYPQREDAFFTGSLMHPRRIQMYESKLRGRLVELKDEEMTTISPVLSAHPSLPLLVGGNSSGRVHVFAPPLPS